MRHNITLPNDQQAAIRREFGLSGQAWLDGFDTLLARCADRWQLTFTGFASGGLPINVILFATRANGDAVVLKVAHPHPEQRTEMIALAHYGGRPAVRLLDHDVALGATLLERIQPGQCLRQAVDPAVRSSMHIELVDSLPRPCAGIDGLPHFEDWLRRAFAELRLRRGADHPFTRQLTLAETLWQALRRRHPQDCLLHGDLHHENILLNATGEWVAIDPKGVIGPKVMECGRYLHNFLEDELPVARPSAANREALAAIYATRFAAMAATLDVSPAEVAAANLIDAVLSATWTLNSGEENADALALVEAAALMCERLPLEAA